MPAPAEAYRLRAMTVADLDRVVAIEVGAYGHPWSRANFVDSLAAGHDARVLVDEQWQAVGYSVVMHGVDEHHLLNLTVERGCQRRGLGRQLLQAVIDAARLAGAGAIWLEVRAGNGPALALYRGAGFVCTGLRRGYYPARDGREDAVLMSLSLVTSGAGVAAS